MTGIEDRPAAESAQFGRWRCVFHCKRWTVIVGGAGGQLIAKRVCKELTTASFAVRPRPATLDLNLQRRREASRHGFHGFFFDPASLLDQPRWDLAKH